MTDKTIRALFLSYQKELQAYLTSKLRDPELAADLTQETFLRYAEKNAGDTTPVHFSRSYLYRTAHNLAIDHIRSQARRPTDMPGSSVMDDVVDEAPGQVEITLGRERLAQLRAVLAELPPRTQHVFALNRIEGLTYREVAQRLGISESSVQKHLSKALLHVTRSLRNESKPQ